MEKGDPTGATEASLLLNSTATKPTGSRRFLPVGLAIAGVVMLAALAATLLILYYPGSGLTAAGGEMYGDDATAAATADKLGFQEPMNDVFWYRVRIGLFFSMCILNGFLFMASYKYSENTLRSNIIFCTLMIVNFAVILAAFLLVGRITGAYIIGAALAGCCSQIGVVLFQMERKFHWAIYVCLGVFGFACFSAVILHIGLTLAP